jgi:hypothetical protein
MNGRSLASLGNSLRARRLFRNIVQLDVLRLVGLTRRKSHLAENLALIGVGALAGAGIALLLAPSSGNRLRERVINALEGVNGATVSALREAREQAPAPLQQSPRATPDQAPSHAPSAATSAT